MTGRASEAERAKRYRDRKRRGTVMLQDLAIHRRGIELLVARGWLDAEAIGDPAEVREALVKMVNTTLSETPKAPEVPPIRRALKSVQSVLSLGLF